MATVTAQEVTQYDRQIRLWGLEAQNRLRGARVMLFGLDDLGGEICKNLVLAGIGEINICDSSAPREKTLLMTNGIDYKSKVEASLERVKELNPRVDVKVIPGCIADKEPGFFSGYNLVIVTDYYEKEQLVRVSEICRKAEIKMIIGAHFGMYGIGFNDFLNHEFVLTLDTGESVKGNTEYTPFITSIEAKDPQIKKREAKKQFLLPLHTFKAILESSSELQNAKVNNKYNINDEIKNNVQIDVPPVAAIIGGILGQEAIKAIGLKEVPIENWLLFNGELMTGNCIKI